MSINRLLKVIVTVGACGIALFFFAELWRAYVLAPWTRDGRVSAQVIRLAPQVSGQVSEILVIDNQRVRKGDLLYRIDPQAYLLAKQQRAADLAEARELFLQRQDQFNRRNRLGEAIAREEVDNAKRDLAIAQARVNSSKTQLDQAQLDLERTEVHAPVDGYVVQLRLQNGDYAAAGDTNLFIVDQHSFWVTGYFEETKLEGIHTGASASIKLLGYTPVLQGRVASMGRGIADDNDLRSAEGLPTVSPTFSWVRLAQRIPVRIELDSVPEGVELAAGMTASVEVEQPGAARHWRLTEWLQGVM